MAIDFPTSPTLNQTLTSGSTTWRWNGSSWVVVPQTITASGLGLGNVENTALSTWAGSANLTTLGTVATGTWNATNIGLSKGGTNASLTATNGAVAYSTASALALTAAGTSGNVLVSNGADAPSWASGLTLNAQQALLLNPYGASAGNTSELRFAELTANGLSYVGFKAANNIPSSLTWVLPSGDGGKGQYLVTDGSANLSWTTANYPCQGRLTLSSGNAVPASDVTAATTLYFTPYNGNSLALYNTTLAAWETYNFTQFSTTIPLVTNANYDVFILANGSPPSPSLQLQAWQGDSVRGFSLSSQNGVLVLSTNAAYRYVGTIRTTTSGQSEDSLYKRFVWNMYNQVARPFLRQDGTVSWTNASTAYVNARNQAGNPNRVNMVIGQPTTFVDCWLHASSANGTAGQGSIQVLSYDSASSFVSLPNGVAIAAYIPSQAASQRAWGVARNFGYPAIGYRNLYWNERIISTGTTTIYGATDSIGITGYIIC